MFDLCRLCGTEKSFIDLQDMKESEFNIYVLVEQYCNVELNNSKLLPQNVCIDCVTIIKSFIEFTDQVKTVQSNLEDKLIKSCIQESSDIKNCLIVLENIETTVEQDKSDDFNVIKVEDFAGENSNYLEPDYSSDYSMYDPQNDTDRSKKGVKRNATESDEDFEISPKRNKRKGRKTRKGKTKAKPVDDDNEEVTVKEEHSRDIDEDESVTSSQKKAKPKVKYARQGKILFESADTVEKLFKDEIDGTSQINQIPTLNIPESDKNTDGTVTEGCLEKIPAKFWRDFQFSCELCNIDYNSIFDYRGHCESKHPDKDIFVCNECTDQKFQQVSGFVNHMIIKHYEHLRLSCIFCSELFWNMPAMYEHCRTKHPISSKKMFPCFVCGIYCETLLDLKDHKMTHVKKETSESFALYKDIFYDELNGAISESKYNLEIEEEFKNEDGTVSENYQGKLELWNEFASTCYECFAECGSPYELMGHYRSKHPNIKHKFNCKTCQTKPLVTMRSLLHHGIKSHSKSLSYCCVVCSKQHWSYVALYHHYRNVHSTFRTCLCLACGLHFDDYVRLRFHATSHKLVPSSERGRTCIRCYKCSSVFESKDEYNQHSCRLKIKADRANKPAKLYMCEVCGKNYSSTAALANHVSTHDEKKEYVYCDLCGQKFACKYRLKYHKKIHTTQKLFECEICHVKLRYKHTLTRHYTTHTGERPFSCNFCEKRFSAKSDMKIHQRLHTGDFPYECTACGDRYPSWSNLFKHAKSRHKVDIRSEGIKNIRKVREQLEMEQFGTVSTQEDHDQDDHQDNANFT